MGVCKIRKGREKKHERNEREWPFMNNLEGGSH